MSSGGSQQRFGELVGRGRTSDVYAYGSDSVVKVPHADVPGEWAGFEASITAAVRAAGVPAPEVRDVVSHDGRDAIVFERVEGPSMWQQMVEVPAEAEQLARELSAMQRLLLSIGIPAGVPELTDRLCLKLDIAHGLAPAERAEATELVRQLPRGAALLHGDLHPGNVLMSAAGPVVIDWFDATIGHPIADVVRSSLLMQPLTTAAPQHLPGAPSGLLARVHQTYISEFNEELDTAGPQLENWRAVVAAARLAEHAEVDEQVLIDLWRERTRTGLADEPSKIVGDGG